MDYTEKENNNKAQTYFNFLKKEKDIDGVIELVISGSKFKVRLVKFNCYVMIKLQGIKTLPFDKNFPDYEKYSNKAF